MAVGEGEGEGCNVEDEAGFKWGPRVSEHSESYKSVVYEGEDFSVYNYVFCNSGLVFCDSGLSAPFVGKLMRLWEDKSGKKCRIRWFFRSSELPPKLPGVNYDRSSKELYIAAGNQKGVENENLLDVILSKCKVLCTTKNPKNIMPSEVQLKAADHFFSRAYDVAKKKIVTLDKIPVHLAEKLYNKEEWMISPLPLWNPVEQVRMHEKEACTPLLLEGPKGAEVVGERLVENTEGSGGMEKRFDGKGSLPTSPTSPKMGKASQKIRNFVEHENSVITLLASPLQHTIKQKSEGSTPLLLEGPKSVSTLGKRLRMNSEELGAVKKSKVDAHYSSSTPATVPKMGKTSERNGSCQDCQSSLASPLQQVIKLAREASTSRLSERQSRVEVVGKEQRENTGAIKDLPPALAKGLAKNKPSEKNVTCLKIGSSLVGLQQATKTPEVCKVATKMEFTKGKSANKDCQNKESCANTDICGASKVAGYQHMSGNYEKSVGLEGSGKRRVEQSLEGPKDGGSLCQEWAGLTEMHEAKKSTERKQERKQMAVDTFKPLVDKARMADITVKGATVGNAERSNTPGVETPKISEGSRAWAGYKEGPQQCERICSENPSQQGWNGTLPLRPSSVEGWKSRADKDDAGTIEGRDSSWKEQLNTSGNQIAGKELQKTFFRPVPEEWDSSMGRAREQQRVLHLKNLDPELGSLDIMDTLIDVLQTSFEARLIPPANFTSIQSGEALLKFPNAKSASQTLKKLEDSCLVLSGRPVLASLAQRPHPTGRSKFLGHISLMDVKTLMSADYRRAVATSHCSQPNTFEFQMGLQWRQLQMQQDMQWANLSKLHEEDVKKLEWRFGKGAK